MTLQLQIYQSDGGKQSGRRMGHPVAASLQLGLLNRTGYIQMDIGYIETVIEYIGADIGLYWF